MANPDHRITIEPTASRWRARFSGHVIADSDKALILRETGFPPRVYFPREDVGMEYMSRTQASTHCPFKGDAAYYTLLMDGHFAENAVWTYEDPLPAMAQIAGRLSFYPDRVEVYAVDDAKVNPHPRRDDDPERLDIDVDEVVQHTDSGAGASQRESWPSSFEGPDGDDAGLR